MYHRETRKPVLNLFLWFLTVLSVTVPSVIAQLYIRSPGERGPVIRQYALGKCVMTDQSPVPVNTGGYAIEISDNPEQYLPGETYRVTLRGNQKFSGFALIVNLKSRTDSFLDTSPFRLFRDALSKFSDGCSNAVVHASSIPKSEIQVMYKAPSPGSGCVLLRAAVQDLVGIWHTGENGLVKELCEAVPRTDYHVSEAETGECCACSEAEYDMTFEGLWSKQTHPKDFPTNEWFTHFSDIVGASHSADFHIFQEDRMASDGVRQVATTGFARKLENELKLQPDKVKTVIKASGLWFPNLNGRTSASFSVDKNHHTMSVLSMLGPSPDWIVGLDGLSLCQRNCSWTPSHVVDLHLYDGGVANGVKYQGDNSPTIPQQPIRRITSTDPNTPQSPFYDPSAAPLKPFARLLIRRQSVREGSCAGAEGSSGPANVDPVFKVAEGEDRVECAVTNWTDWTTCSATCGKGIQMRTRQYVNPDKADMFQCTSTLIEKQMCEAVCVGDVSCRTTDWSDWSDCSVVCGKGTRSRSRRYFESRARKLCNMDLVEREPCMGMKAVCDPSATPDPRCAVTPWSDWSPCTVTCGKGLKIRTRLYMNPHTSGTCNVEIMQNSPCMAEKPDCTVGIMEAKHICMLPKLVGPCRGYFPRWYYDAKKKICSQFVYGGCRGNRNNFERYSDCQGTCDEIFKDINIEVPSIDEDEPQIFPEEENMRNMIFKILQPESQHLRNYQDENNIMTRSDARAQEAQPRKVMSNADHLRSYVPDTNVPRNKIMSQPPDMLKNRKFMPQQQRGNDLNLPQPVDCMATEWSDWTPCSQSCGNGKKERRRMVKQLPVNGGKPCPSRLVQRRRCNYDIPCN